MLDKQKVNGRRAVWKGEGEQLAEGSRGGARSRHLRREGAAGGRRAARAVVWGFLCSIGCRVRGCFVIFYLFVLLSCYNGMIIIIIVVVVLVIIR